MHQSVMDWVASVVEFHELADKCTLEVGSLNENGTVRSCFAGEYIGVDMRPGQDVDRVAKAHQLPYLDAYFDVVVSTEMLEHDRQFWLSLPEMGRVLKEDGLMILTARGNGFPPHAYPNDYWRFMPDAGPVLLQLAGCATLQTLSDPSPNDPGIFALGRRNPVFDDDMITDSMRNLATYLVERAKQPDGPNRANVEACAMTGLDLAHMILGDESA